MNILISDFVIEDAHKDMNMNFVRAISKFSDCTLLSVNGYYTDFEDELCSLGVRVVKMETTIKRGAIAGRKTSLRLMSYTGKLLKNEKYHGIIVLCFETSCIPFKLSRFKDIPLILFYHRNIDELGSTFKRKVFNTYKDKTYHVVFEKFFERHMLEDYGVKKENLFVIPHPAKEQKNVKTENVIDCVGLCNSNDELFIQSVIDRDEEFATHDYKVLLRSRAHKYSGKAVTVISGYLEREKYDELLSSATSVFVPFPKDYVYRLSGSIYDALSRRKKVFTTSKYYSEDYRKRYPNTCNYVDSVERLLDNLGDKTNPDAGAFDLFLIEHSIDKVSHDIEVMMNHIISKT